MRGNKLLKLIDRYIGIPIVFILGLFKVKGKQQSSNNIAFLMTAALGDTLLFSTLVKELKEKFPDKKLTMFCGVSNRAMVELVGGFDQIVTVSIKNPFKAIATIRNYQFDVFVDCGQWPRLNAILTYFAKAHIKVGFKTPGQFKHFTYDHKVLHSKATHEEINFKNLLKEIGLVSSSTPKLTSAGEVPGKYCIFHLCPSGERSYLKEWPLKNWVELARFVIDKGYKVYLTGGPVDFDKNESLASKFRAEEIVNLSGKTNLQQVTDYLASASFVVSVNTGIMHMAAAVNAPLIALHGPTDPKRWGPLSEKAIIMKPSLSCSPCLNLGFEYGCDQNLCMQDIKVESVKEKIVSIL